MSSWHEFHVERWTSFITWIFSKVEYQSKMFESETWNIYAVATFISAWTQSINQLVNVLQSTRHLWKSMDLTRWTQWFVSSVSLKSIQFWQFFLIFFRWTRGVDNHRRRTDSSHSLGGRKQVLTLGLLCNYALLAWLSMTSKHSLMNEIKQRWNANAFNAFTENGNTLNSLRALANLELSRRNASTTMASEWSPNSHFSQQLPLSPSFLLPINIPATHQSTSLCVDAHKSWRKTVD